MRPLLLSIFVNDLPNVVVHAQINMYADNTELHCCGEELRNIQNDIQFDLCRLGYRIGCRPTDCN